MSVPQLKTSEIASVETSLRAVEAMSSKTRPGRLWCIDGYNGNDNNTGRDWDHAKKTIQPVLTQIRTDRNDNKIPDNIWDWVLVAPGNYTEDLIVPACHLIGLGEIGNDRGVRILATADPGVKGAVTAVTGISGFHVENIRFQTANAIKLMHFGVLNASWIRNCMFIGSDGSPTTVTHGIYIENSLGVHIVGCRFYALNRGIYLGPGGADKFFNNGEIRACQFETQNVAITITDNMVANGTFICDNMIDVQGASNNGIDLTNCGTKVFNNYVSVSGIRYRHHQSFQEIEILPKFSS